MLERKSSKEIIINQEHVSILESLVGKKVTFVLLPVFNTSYDINYSLKIKDKIIDLRNLNISKEDYLDYIHFREHGTEIIAENLCKRMGY